MSVSSAPFTSYTLCTFSPRFHSSLYIFNHKIPLPFWFLAFEVRFILTTASGSWSLMKRDKADHQAIMLCTRRYFFHLSKLNGAWAFPLACQYFHKIQGCLMKVRENSCTMAFPRVLSWCHMALCKCLGFILLLKD